MVFWEKVGEALQVGLAEALVSGVVTVGLSPDYVSLLAIQRCSSIPSGEASFTRLRVAASILDVSSSGVSQRQRLSDQFHRADVLSSDVQSGDDAGETHVAMVRAGGVGGGDRLMSGCGRSTVWLCLTVTELVGANCALM